MQDRDSHLLIQGNFSQPKRARVLAMSARLLSILLGVLIFGALIIYGVRVHYEADINKTARQTRELNDDNKELLVHLNRIRSYKNVENAATQVPHLHLAEAMIEVPSTAAKPLPQPPPKHREAPRVYGY